MLKLLGMLALCRLSAAALFLLPGRALALLLLPGRALRLLLLGLLELSLLVLCLAHRPRSARRRSLISARGLHWTACILAIAAKQPRRTRQQPRTGRLALPRTGVACRCRSLLPIRIGSAAARWDRRTLDRRAWARHALSLAFSDALRLLVVGPQRIAVL